MFKLLAKIVSLMFVSITPEAGAIYNLLFNKPAYRYGT